MKINMLNHEKKLLEFEIIEGDTAIPELLTNKLLENNDVAFASYRQEHPLIAKLKIIVRTKNKDALALTLETLTALKKETNEFRELFKKA